jgi:hypothetical protein
VSSDCGASTATKSTLVHQCEYAVALSYQDVLLHDAGVHTLTRYTVVYDYVTLSPLIRAPVSGMTTKQDLQLDYDLLEDMYINTVKITLTFTGCKKADEGCAGDSYSPHVVQLRNNLTSGNTWDDWGYHYAFRSYAFHLNLLDLDLYLPFNTTNGNVNLTTHAGVARPGEWNDYVAK